MTVDCGARRSVLRIIRTSTALALAVDGEVGVEDLVAAVLGVGLREHHQPDVAGVALQLGEGLDQVVDLVVRQRQAEVLVGDFQRARPWPIAADMGQRLGQPGVEQVAAGLRRRRPTRSCGHAAASRRLAALARSGLAPPLSASIRPDLSCRRNSVTRSTRWMSRAAVVGDVGGLGAHGDTVPRRGITTTSSPGRGLGGVAIGQQRGELVGGGRVERAVSLQTQCMAGRHADDAGALTAACRRGSSAWARKAKALPPEMLEVFGEEEDTRESPKGC